MKDLTDLTILLDRSGSMVSGREAMEEGLNSYVTNMKNSGVATNVSLYRFNDEHEIVFVNQPITSVGQFTITPAGATALKDALGKTIDHIGKRLSDMPESERPNNVIVVVITDGQDNAPEQRYTLNRIKEMIQHQREVYKWTFLFLGADQDAITEAINYGMAPSNAMNYSKSRGSTQKMADLLTKSTLTSANRSMSDKLGGVGTDSAFAPEDQDITDQEEAVKKQFGGNYKKPNFSSK
jgi:uncharacterized protein YegL